MSKCRYTRFNSILKINTYIWAYSAVVSVFDFHRSDRGSNPGRGGKVS